MPGATSLASNSVSKTTYGTDTQTPTAPATVSASATAWNNVNLTWTPGSDDMAVTSYTIYRNGTAISKVAGSATSFADVTTAQSAIYTYSVAATDAAGHTSSPTAPLQVTTPAYTPPPDTTAPTPAPTLTATAKNPTEIDLSWTAATDNVAVAGYRIYRGGTQIATSASTTYVDSPLTAGPRTATTSSPSTRPATRSRATP